MMVSAAEVLAAARSMIDTPFHHQGRQPGVGLDCAGLIVCAFAAVGIEVRDRAGYSRQPFPGNMSAALSENAELVRGELQPADVLWLRFDEPQHLAFLTDRGTIIHALYTRGAVCEHRFAAAWRHGRLVSAWRHPEVRQ